MAMRHSTSVDGTLDLDGCFPFAISKCKRVYGFSELTLLRGQLMLVHHNGEKPSDHGPTLKMHTHSRLREHDLS